MKMYTVILEKSGKLVDESTASHSSAPPPFTSVNIYGCLTDTSHHTMLEEGMSGYPYRYSMLGNVPLKHSSLVIR